MQVLSKLFGSSARVKMLRLFLFNPKETYEKKELISRTKITPETAARELNILRRAGLIKKRVFYKQENRKTGNKNSKVPVRKKTVGWTVDPKFPFLKELQGFLVQTLSLSDKDILRRLRPAIGKLKIVVISGVFIRNWESRVDILIVGDKIKEKHLAAVIKGLEAEIGREIKYSVFTTADFNYRLTVCDKLIRDVFDYEHRVILDQLGTTNHKKAQ